MGRKLLFLGVGLGVGYLIGARAGREQYERLVTAARGLWDDPRVAKARADVEAYARAQAPVVRDRAEALAHSIPEHVTEGVQKAAEAAASAAGRTTVIAKDSATKAKDAAAKVAEAARSTAAKVTGSTTEPAETEPTPPAD
ncbi:MAG: hypothetical protein QM635_05205 [Microbacteriaceae bacterium]